MLRKRFSIFAISLLIISWWVVLTASGAEEGNAWVGILIGGDIIIPVGVFQNAKWRTSWPEPINDGGFINDSDGPRPKTLPLDKVPTDWLPDGIKIPRNRILLGTGSNQQKLMVEKAIEFDSDCTSGWGLKASFVGKTQKPEGVDPKLKAGLVTSGISKAWASETVDPNSSESRSLLKLLREKFDSAEQDALRIADSLNIKHPTSKNERIYKPLKPEKIFKMKFEQTKKILYFISVVRQYENPDCYAATLYNVWVLWNNQEYKIVAADMMLSDCDWKEGNWIYPLGMVSIEGKEYVTSVELGYEWENYTIKMLDKDALKIVLFVRGGGC